MHHLTKINKKEYKSDSWSINDMTKLKFWISTIFMKYNFFFHVCNFLLFLYETEKSQNIPTLTHKIF